jgi:hypothetical protein
MVNPSLLEQFGKERGREILEASRTPRGPGPWPKVRQRLGWSLIGLGVHLALDGHRGQALRPLTRS